VVEGVGVVKLTSSSSFRVALGNAEVRPALRFVAAIVCNATAPALVWQLTFREKLVDDPRKPSDAELPDYIKCEKGYLQSLKSYQNVSVVAL
jgi:hypothetical protein